MDPKPPVEKYAGLTSTHAAAPARPNLCSHPDPATSSEAASADKPVVGLSGALDMFGIGRSSFYALVKAGKIAKPIRVSKRRVVWLRAELRSYLDEKIQARDRA